ncbi:MAG: DUF1150 domain-containing protein [Pseudomonadota bacterium]|nr:DUF1150 domain-containing protein [Pseudomonadota bacterium]
MNKDNEHNSSSPPAGRPVMSPDDFARLGGGHVAYIKPMSSAAAIQLFPGLRGIPEGIDLFALVGADGTPLTLTDSRDAAVANAIQNDLEPVSLH